jgi:cytoskeletal protein CcmA (bactofilin family)
LAIFGRSEPAPGPARETAAAAGVSAPTVLGPRAKLVGELSGDEDIVVEGRIEGKIRAERRVTVGPSGEVQGDVLARSVLVAGAVRGQIVASERAELAASAVVDGTVQAPKVVIAEGAHLQGSVVMTVGPSESRSDSVPPEARSASEQS